MFSNINCGFKPQEAMAKKFNEDTNLDPEELAKHLRQPVGETGKKVGVEMNKSNKHICLNTYKVLSPSTGDHILEIGMGNGYFVPDLLEMAGGLKYHGVDYSETMVDEARQINEKLVDQGVVQFTQGSIDALPFADATFDSISTTNTLYFWPAPLSNAQELFRVLKPGGKLVLGYRSKDCMDQLEITKYGFVKYETKGVEQLLLDAGFSDVSTQNIKEPELEFDGNIFQIEGLFTSAKKL